MGQENRFTAYVCPSAYADRKTIFLSAIFLSTFPLSARFRVIRGSYTFLKAVTQIDMKSRLIIALIAFCCVAPAALADEPAAKYILPAGGQRGTSVDFRVGGLYLHESCPFEMTGQGITAPPKINATETIWFEGPVIPLPDSQQAEDYPRDMAGTMTIAADAALGLRTWRIWTDQGAVPSRPFIIGELPEIVEQEIDGDPIPVSVTLPITINGRVFPREDVDLWSFEAKAGQTITCMALTARLGSPFDARLEIRDSRGSRIAESSATSPPGTDALVRFTAPADGVYTVGIHDLKFGGLQHYVYRLTITAGHFVDRIFPLGGRRGATTKFELSGSSLPPGLVDALLPADGSNHWLTNLGLPGSLGRQIAVDLDDLREQIEQEPNDTLGQAQQVDAPVVCNGRIGRPGDVDYWSVRVLKGQALELGFSAVRLGSPLDAVIALVDREGKEIVRVDTNFSDRLMQHTFGEGGEYFVRIEERTPSRGSEAFAYRLRIAPPAPPDFAVRGASDAVTVNRGGETKFKIRVHRANSFAEPIQMEFENLPPGVSATNALIPAKAGEFDLVLKADMVAAIGAQPVRIRGTAMIAGKQVVRPATFASSAQDEIVSETVLVAVAVPTPFKVKGVFEVKYAQRGGKFVRHFSIDRAGFDGPLQVRLADRQTRHLQGVRGPAIDVPAGVSEFDYPVFLPPWMEIGRTSRTVVMAVGEVVDPDGSRHKVSYTSLQQNEQIVALVDPGQLSVELERQSIVATPGESHGLTIQIGRGQGVNVPVRVELIAAGHIKGISADPVSLAVGQTTGTLNIRFAPDSLGPFNMPLVVRATAMKGENDPVVAEAKLEVVRSE